MGEKYLLHGPPHGLFGSNSDVKSSLGASKPVERVSDIDWNCHLKKHKITEANKMKYFSPNAKLVSTYHTSTANVIGDQPIGAIGRNIRKNPIALPLLVSEVGISGFIQEQCIGVIPQPGVEGDRALD